MTAGVSSCHSLHLHLNDVSRGLPGYPCLPASYPSRASSTFHVALKPWWVSHPLSCLLMQYSQVPAPSPKGASCTAVAPWVSHALCTLESLHIPSRHPFVHSPDWAPCLTVLGPLTGSALTSSHSALSCHGDRMPDKGNLRLPHGGLNLAHSLRAQSTTVGKTWEQETGVAAFVPSTVRWQGSQCWLPVCVLFFFIQFKPASMGCPLGVTFLPPLNLLETPSQTCLEVIQ